TVVLPWEAAPSPLDAFRAVAARTHPFFRWAAGGPRDLARWSYLAFDPRRTLAIGGSSRGLARDPFAALGSLWPDPAARDAPADAPPPALFERLVAASPAPFSTYVGVGAGRAILSTSPERFLFLEGDRAQTRPMKGTRPRGRTPAEDRRLARALLESAKDRAEL